MLNGQTIENERSVALSDILKDCRALDDSVRQNQTPDITTEDSSQRLLERKSTLWHQLQEHVNIYMDNSLASRSTGCDIKILTGAVKVVAIFVC